MRWRPGNMGYLTGGGTDQKIRSRLIRARQHQRCVGQNGSQEDLKAAITANIVERAPDDGLLRGWFDGSHQAR